MDYEWAHASLQKENLPPSFTICFAFMLENWGIHFMSPLILLLDDKEQNWLLVELISLEGHTEFVINLEGEQITVGVTYTLRGAVESTTAVSAGTESIIGKNIVFQGDGLA